MPFDSAGLWQQARSFHHSRYDEETLAARECSISLCLPALECASTVGAIVETLVGLRERGAIDQLVVVDPCDRLVVPLLAHAINGRSCCTNNKWSRFLSLGTLS